MECRHYRYPIAHPSNLIYTTALLPTVNPWQRLRRNAELTRPDYEFGQDFDLGEGRLLEIAGHMGYARPSSI